MRPFLFVCVFFFKCILFYVVKTNVILINNSKHKIILKKYSNICSYTLYIKFVWISCIYIFHLILFFFKLLLFIREEAEKISLSISQKKKKKKKKKKKNV
jgi:hypothetical protein